MAIDVEPVADFDDFHFSPESFDALLNAHGTMADVRLAMRCGCWDPKTGAADPACKICYPYSVVYDDPIPMMVFGPNRKPTRRIDAIGSFDVGDAFFTIPSGVLLPWGTRISLPLTLMLADDTLIKGKFDIVRFAKVLALEKAHYTVRNPPTGHPYEDELVPLVIGTDIALNDRTITWLTTDVPDGTSYTVRVKAHSEWIVAESHDRNEHGQPLPYRYLARRVDYFTHPTAGSGLSY